MEKNDQQLLAEFLDGHDRAFTALVHRHINLIYSAALRQTNPALADDITQAVFILLARKGRSLRRHTNLAGWLFKTTRYIASKTLRAELRRQHREQQALAMQQLHTADHAWEQIKPQLDAAVAALREPDRSVLLHRYFNNQSVAQTSQSLGLTEDITKKSSSRALEKLRAHFAKHGFTITATILATALQTHTVTAAPQSIIVKAGAAPATLNTSLVTATLAAWRLAFLRNVAIATIPLTFIISILLISQLNDPIPKLLADSNESAPHQSAAPAAPSQEIQTAAPLTNSDRSLLFRALDAATGQPITNALLAISRVTTTWDTKFETFTDAAGQAIITYPEKIGRFDIGLIAPGWMSKYVTWRTDQDDEIPTEYTMRVPKVDSILGGKLVDESGQPIAGAEVTVSTGERSDYAQREAPRERDGFPGELPLGKTDAQGRWTCAIVPDANKGFDISVTHPQFTPAQVCSFRSMNSIVASTDDDIQKLLARTHVAVMKRGLALKGIVQDRNANPIAAANIKAGSGSNKKEIISKDDGTFEIKSLPHGAISLTVSSEGYAPKRVVTQLKPNSDPLVIELTAGSVLRLRITDEDGAPVPEATVRWVDSPFSFGAPQIDWSAKSDGAGQVEWTSAPSNTQIELVAHKEGFSIQRNIRVLADSDVHQITLRRALTATGFVIDADTQQPIAEFKAIPRYGPGDTGLYRGSTRTGKDGQFTLILDEPGNARIQIEAPGYEPAESSLLKKSETNLTFALKRTTAKPETTAEKKSEPNPPPDPNETIAGLVLDADGNPVPKATVALLSIGASAGVGKGQLATREAANSTITDPNGNFILPLKRNAHSIAVLHKSGFARVRISSPPEPVTIHLQPLGAIQGRVDPAIKQPYSHIALKLPLEQPFGIYFEYSQWRIEPDSTGRFSISLLPPGLYEIHLGISEPGIPFHHRRLVDVLPGATATLEIKEAGPFVKGRIISPDLTGFPGTRLSFNPTGPKLPMIGQERSPTDLDYWQTEQAKAALANRVSYLLEARPDGAIATTEGIVPGDYEIITRLNRIRMKATITVPASAASKPEYDLGDIRLEPLPD